MNRSRKTPPSYVQLMYRAIVKSKSEQLSLDQLVKIIKDETLDDNETAAEVVANCISDKILIPVVVDNGRNSPRLKVAEGRPLSLPKLIEIPASQHDYYCFECHLPGDVELCPQCPRSFHRECYRKEPEKPNYVVPSAKVQKNPLPEFSSADDDDESERSDSEPETKSSTPQLALNTADTTADGDSMSSVHLEETKGNLDLNLDMKSKVDVLYLGELRPPYRSRRANITSSYAKNEILPFDEEDDLEFVLCTCCRLKKCAALRNPPNLQSDELCYLLNFTYVRNRSWISQEIISFLDSVSSGAKDLEVLRKILLQTPISPSDISQKITNNSYTYLMEFLIDILDIQHNIGVLYGDSTEYDSTKWLVRDVTHDLAEIGRCPDCYRYSNHKKSKGWFCKPCVQRHELVFAKYPGFPFWPAKVIRVLSNGKYDVRFFGGNHSRALVDAKNIRPIDTDPKQLKLSRGRSLRSAMDELKYHQVLLNYPPSQFSFHADHDQVEAILSSVLMGSNQRKRKRSEVVHNSMHVDDDNGEQSMVVTQSSSRKRRRLQNSPNQGNIWYTRSKGDLQPSLEVQKLQNDLDDALNIIKKNKRRVTELKNQNDQLKETITKMERNMDNVKRKQWCYWCLKEAILLCCFKASYCSESCQKAHWDDGHSKKCKNRDLH